MRQGVRVGIFVVFLVVVIGISIVFVWWFINEHPKQTFKNVVPPPICSQDDKCNQKGPSNSCSPHRCTFNPPDGKTTVCPCPKSSTTFQEISGDTLSNTNGDLPSTDVISTI